MWWIPGVDRLQRRVCIRDSPFTALLAVIMTLCAINKWGGPETSPDMQLPMDMLLAITALAFVAALVAVGGRIIVILRGELSDG